jgi:hypothetical protein
VQAVSTFLAKNNNMAAKPILGEMSFPPTPVIPYSDDERTRFFAACDRACAFRLWSCGKPRHWCSDEQSSDLVRQWSRPTLLTRSSEAVPMRRYQLLQRVTET